MAVLLPNALSANENSDKKYAATDEADVVVVGAGPAGIPAAISAARNGAKVLLVEEDSLVGGAPVDMYVSYLCGGPRLGICKEMREKLAKHYDISGKPSGGSWFFPSTFALVLREMIDKEKNIKLITRAPVCGAIMERKGNSNKILGVEYRDDLGNLFAAKGKVVIDATGTGLLSEFAGAKYMYGREAKSDFGERYALDKADDKVQLCTLMCCVQRFRPNAEIDIDALLQNKSFTHRLVLDSGYNFTKDVPKEKLRSDVYQYLMWAANAQCDTRDTLALGRAQNKLMTELMPILARNFWKQGFTLHIAPKIGVRECRRVIGDKVITSEDLFLPKYPDDVISQGRYVLDSWGRGNLKGMEKKILKFGIPYFATIVKGIDNLMMAGKHISGTSLAMSAYRVQPIVASMGQAVGWAAAEAAKKNTSPRNLEVKEIQKAMAKQEILPKEYA